MQALSGLDSSFLYLETDSQPMHVGGLNIYEGSLSFEDFRSFLLSPPLERVFVDAPAVGPDRPQQQCLRGEPHPLPPRHRVGRPT